MTHLLYWRNMNVYKIIIEHHGTVSAWNNIDKIVLYQQSNIHMTRTHYEAPHIQRLLTDERYDVLSGTNLTEILKEHFPELFI